MAYIVATAEIVSLAFLLIILFGLVNNGVHNRRTRRFLGCLIMVILMLVSDTALRYVTDRAGMSRAEFVLNITTCASIYILHTFFVFYILAMINHRNKNASFGWLYVTAALSLIGVVSFIVFAVNGKTIKGLEKYKNIGTWNSICFVPAVINVIVFIVFLIKKCKYIGIKETVVAFLYVLLPGIFIGVQMAHPQECFVYVAIAWSISCMYILLQVRENKASKLREHLLDEANNMDQLTGLKNRRAYDNTLSKGDSENVGVVFTDVNGLKTTNDDKGHAAGDALLKRYVDVVKKHFYYDTIYRISGDEFVIIVKDSEANFNKMVESFHKSVQLNGQIASIGAYYNLQDESLAELVAKAEKLMYTDKEAYYIRKGLDRRRT